jgi:hypothetical protein
MPSEIAAFGETAPHLANHPLVLIGLALLLLFGVLWALIGSGILRRVDRKTSGVNGCATCAKWLIYKNVETMDVH